MIWYYALAVDTITNTCTYKENIEHRYEHRNNVKQRLCDEDVMDVKGLAHAMRR